MLLTVGGAMKQLAAQKAWLAVPARLRARVRGVMHKVAIRAEQEGSFNLSVAEAPGTPNKERNWYARRGKKRAGEGHALRAALAVLQAAEKGGGG
jgi:hypothetical protein